MTPENPGRHDEDTNKEETDGTKEKVVKFSPTDTLGTLGETVKNNDPETSEKSELVDRLLADRIAGPEEVTNPGKKLADVEDEALVKRLLAKSLAAEVEAETLGDRLGDALAEALVDTLADTLAEVEAETLGDRLGDALAEALVDTLADTLAEVEAETLGDRLGDAVFCVFKASTGCHVGLFVVPFVKIYR